MNDVMGDKVASLQRQLEEMGKTAENNYAMVGMRDAKIAELQQTIEAREGLIRELNEMVGTRDEEVAHLKAVEELLRKQLKEKDDECRNLKHALGREKEVNANWLHSDAANAAEANALRTMLDDAHDSYLAATREAAGLRSQLNQLRREQKQ